MTAPLKSRVSLLKEHGCSKGSCWTKKEFEDGGVLAVVGAGWLCFMSERHFTAGACGLSPTEGGYCDAVAASSQSSNRLLRVVEVKTQPKFAQAKSQLRKGVQFVLGLPDVSPDEVAVELHVKAAPKSSVRPQQRDLTVGTRRFSIQLVVGGKPQFA